MGKPLIHTYKTEWVVGNYLLTNRVRERATLRTFSLCLTTMIIISANVKRKILAFWSKAKMSFQHVF